MLAVDVEREGARDYLGEGARLPDFDATIDHLWVFVRESPGGDLEAAFHATRAQRRLKRLDPPKPNPASSNFTGL